MCLRLSLRIVHDRSDKAIPTLSEGLNEDGCFRRFTQRLAQSLDGYIQTMIEVDEGVCRPELTAQFLPANHLAGPFKQCRQHLKWLFLELYPLSPLVQFPGMEIDLEGTETNNS
jgi:hypothetical protein